MKKRRERHFHKRAVQVCTATACIASVIGVKASTGITFGNPSDAATINNGTAVAFSGNGYFINLVSGDNINVSGVAEVVSSNSYSNCLNLSGGSLTAASLQLDAAHTYTSFRYNSGTLNLTNSGITFGNPSDAATINNGTAVAFSGNGYFINLVSGDNINVSGVAEVVSSNSYSNCLNLSGGSLTAASLQLDAAHTYTSFRYNSGTLNLTNSGITFGNPSDAATINNGTAVAFSGNGYFINLVSGDNINVSGVAEVVSSNSYSNCLNLSGGSLTAASLQLDAAHTYTSFRYNSGTLNLTNSGITFGNPSDAATINNGTAVAFSGNGYFINLVSGDNINVSGVAEVVSSNSYSNCLNLSGGSLTAASLQLDAAHTYTSFRYNSGTLNLTNSGITFGNPSDAATINNGTAVAFSGNGYFINLVSGDNINVSGVAEVVSSNSYSNCLNLSGGSLTAASLQLDAAHTYTSFRYNSGTLNLTNSGITFGNPSDAATINNGTAVAFSGNGYFINLVSGDNINVSGVAEVVSSNSYSNCLNLSGGSLTAASLQLDAAHTYTSFRYNSGTLNLTNSGITFGNPSDAATINNGTAVAFSGNGYFINLVSGDNINVSGVAEVVSSNSYSNCLNLSGGSLTAASLQLDAAHTYTSFRYNSGTLNLTNSGITFGNPSDAATINNGTAVAFSGNGYFINLVSGDNINVSGVAEVVSSNSYSNCLNLSGGSLTAASLQLDAAHTYTSFRYNSGTLNLTNSGITFGNPSDAATINNGTAVAFSGNGYFINLVSGDNINVSGVAEVVSSNSYSNCLNLSGGSLTAASLQLDAAHTYTSFRYNSGTLNLLQQQVQIGPGGWFGSSVHITAGDNLNFGGGLQVLLGGTVTMNGGTLTAGAISVANGSTGFVLTSGTIGIIGAAKPFVAQSVSGIAISSVSGFTPSTGQPERSLMVAYSVTFGGTTDNWAGSLNLANNDLDIQNANLATVTNEIKTGYANGGWAGNGITSGNAAADSTHLTALGVIQNNQSGTALFTASNPFDGVTPAAGDILVKYTYYGDTNLSGAVDGSDYSRIDAAYLGDRTSPGEYTGWFNGDFNYDGVVNGSDYTLIDNAFNTQGAQLTSQIAISTAQIAGGSAVPEPSLVGGILTLGLLSTRRRRYSI